LVEAIEHRGAQLVQSAVRELHLRLDPDRSRDLPTLRLLDDEIEEDGLPDAGLAAKDDDPTATVERVGSGRLEKLALGMSSKQPHAALPPSDACALSLYARRGALVQVQD
jgi:hypothetical protein